MKKILCFILALLLCLSSVYTAYASGSDSAFGGTGGTIGGGTGSSSGDHGGTGGSIDWEKLQQVDNSDFNKVIGTLGFLMHPDNAAAGAGLQLANLLGLDNLDDDSKSYINDNIMDNTRTDGTYYYFNQNFIQNVNQKTQNRVHALNGYFLIEPINTLSYNTLNKYYKAYTTGAILDNATGSFYTSVQNYISSASSILFKGSDSSSYFYTYHISNKIPDNCYLCVVGSDVKLYDADSMVFKTSAPYFGKFSLDKNGHNDGPNYKSSLFLSNFTGASGCLGAPVRIFYSAQDARNYLGQGAQYYSPNLPNKTIKVPINYASIKPTLDLDFDISGKLEAEIQGQLDLAFNAWLDKLAELNLNPSNPTPTPGTSGGGSGGDHGGTGGGFGTVTPTPNPDDGFTSGTYDLLEEIYKWLVSFGEKHDIFARKITDYIEANDGKLDQIIEAINALGDGKTETDANGCKYDFTALSDFMTDLWNESDQKFDNMISLLEENNKYQQKLVNSLNEIKAILVTQTVLELFQDRSSETANKAKDKFPTSIPWDIAMVVNAMAAEPQEIKFNLPIEIQSLGIHEEINVDLSSDEWEKLAKTCRYLLSILFILFMIQLSRKMFYSGGGDD